ncbi:MAG: 2-succinyl-5-enolpyruvyl-6-hydroxy-3-cyclohexene-1-carboxylic-acid synthase [Candidatus Dormibacteraceae bacterium]
MREGSANHAFAATFVDQLAASGLRDAVVAPGSRSAPLAMALARHPGIRVHVHIDERSAGFYALGMAKAAGRPPALLTTSGTAAAELHAAVIEARQSFSPLIVLTADRPPELRDSGANQSIDQIRLFGSAPRWFCDTGTPEWVPGAERVWRRLAARACAEAAGPPAGPVHLNCAFREPLTPPPDSPPRALPAGLPFRFSARRAEPPPGAAASLAEELQKAQRPVLVAGTMADGARLAEPLAALARGGAPLLAEATSGCRVSGLPGVVGAYDALLRDWSWAAAHRPDLVLRVGGTPTSKALNAWLAASQPRTLLVDPDRAWADPDSLATEIVACDPEPLLAEAGALVRPRSSAWAEAWARGSEVAAAALGGALDKTPLHEGHAVRALARHLRPDATLVVGSSMAIRDVDAFWPVQAGGPRFLANRGASGIDGLVSTALGVAAAGGPTVALLGDLSLYHDMNGLWAVRRHGLSATFVVLDNDGGGIFSHLPPAEHEDVFEELFGTPLGLRMEDVAALYGLRFASVDSAAHLDRMLAALLGSGDATLVAVRFRREGSLAGHRAAWRAVSEALAGG